MNDNETGTALEVVPTTTLGALVKAELDVQITTAKRYPRSVSLFKKKTLELATIDEETAAACFYTLPRAGKSISGPSVRLAEIAGSAWGNMRYGARVVSDDGRILTAQGICHDLENNVAATIESHRRVTDKKGRRFSDDMIVTTSNAACSIALRNAIFRVIPMAYIRDILEKCKQVAIGGVKTLETKRADMLAYFAKMGVAAERVLAVIERPGLDDVTLDDLVILKGLATAIKDGDTTVDEAFPVPQAKQADTKPASRTDEVAAKLGANKPNGETPAQPPPREPGDEPQPNTADLDEEDAKDREVEEICEDVEAAVAAKSNLKLQAAGARMMKQRDWLGEQRYQGCLKRWQAGYAAITGHKTKAEPTGKKLFVESQP